MMGERSLLGGVQTHAPRALSLGKMRRLSLTALSRTQVRQDSLALVDPSWFVEGPSGVVFGQGDLPMDLGESGRVFDQGTELRWDAEEAWRLAVADPTSDLHDLLGQGLEEECRDRVMPCAGGSEAPGMAECPWQAVVARRVFSHGHDALLRLVGVHLVATETGSEPQPDGGS